ncbi:DNA-formamidopyrimidine glycosylase family protein [Tunturiibacter gelidiferens]|uniref:DNA-formamidopyrimidine glycosylase family protein n=1 Tax=Tunturiibacter gelidiferens TaxID=3069689 RepID=UPI003D9B31AD
MPELPDISAYLSALEPRILGQPLTHLRIASPFLLRTARPSIEEIENHTVTALHRIGKRIAFEFDNGLWLVLHLMIAGRLHWRPLEAKLGGRNNLAAFDFPTGSLVLTEAGSKRRASFTSSPTKPSLRKSTPAESTSSPPTSTASAPPLPQKTAP